MILGHISSQDILEPCSHGAHSPVEGGGVTDPSPDSDCPDKSELGWGKHRQRDQNHNTENRDQRGENYHREAQSRIVKAEMGKTRGQSDQGLDE